MPNEELTDLRAGLLQLGAQLGVVPRESETSVAFAGRCTGAARRLRLSAGITWSDYELIKAAGKSATFGLRKPPESSPFGGPRWTIRVGEPLDELAARLGTYESQP